MSGIAPPNLNAGVWTDAGQRAEMQRVADWIRANAASLSALLTQVTAQSSSIAEMHQAGGPPTGPAGGDLGGSYPNPDVSKVQGVTVSVDPPTDANILIADGSQYTGQAVSGDATLAHNGALTLAATIARRADKLSVFAATTSAELASVLSDETGSGGGFVRATSPTISSPVLVTPALGTPASGVATNLTGTASGLTAGSVTTNANLTGPITSGGNATSIASQTGTGTKFVVDTAPTLVGATVSGAKLALSGVLATLKSSQTTAPTIAAGAALGTGPAVSVQAGSTDICGLLNITAGTLTGTGTLATVTFNGTYAAAPKMIILGAGGIGCFVAQPYVSSITTTTFVISAAVAPTATLGLSLFYMVIE